MNRPFPILAEMLLVIAALAALLAISYLLDWAHRRFPKPPAAEPAAAEEERDATVYIEGPLIMSAPDRQFHRAREPQ